MPAVRAVVFDFGGVLCFHPEDREVQRVAEACGLPFNTLVKAFWSNRPDYDTGRVSPEEYWRNIALSAAREFPAGLIPSLVRLEVDLWNRYDQRVLDWVEALRASGYRTGILSNLPRPLGEALRATPGLLDVFDHVSFSYELGFMKPQPEIYLDTVEGLDVAPGEALFLDDRPENVAGARTVGLQAEIFTSFESCASVIPARYALPAPAVARRQ